MKKTLSIILVLAMLITALSACGGGSSQSSAAPSGNTPNTTAAPSTPSRTDVNVSINKAQNTLDPQATSNVQDRIVLWQIFEGLMFYNELKGEAEPRLAESYSADASGKVYTFKLRDNVYFHNGDKMTAKDVEFSLNRAMTDVAKGVKNNMTNIDTVKAVDDKTIEITLKVPYAPLLLNLCYVFVLSEKEVTEQGEAFGTTICSGTGPYKVKEAQFDQKIVLEAFDKYYRGEASIKTVNFYVVTDSSAGMISFESGDLDWYGCTSTDFMRLKDDQKYNSASAVSNHITYMAVNPLANDVLAKEKVRQAIAYAINKDELNKAAFDGYGEPADFMYSPKRNIAAPGDGFKYEYNPEKAKELLKEAGYPNGVDVGKLLCFTGSHFEICATVIQAQLEKVGIKCELEWNEQSVSLKRGTDHDFDLIVSGSSCSGDYDDIRKRTYSGLSTPFVDYANLPEYDWKALDALLDEASAQTDPARRLQMNQEYSDKFMQSATQLPLLHKCVFFVWNKNLQLVNSPVNPIIYDWKWN